MYKSPAARQAKDLYGQLRTARQNPLSPRRKVTARMCGNAGPGDRSWGTDRRLRSGWDRANSPVVSADDIAELVSMWTGVPLMQLAERNPSACSRWKMSYGGPHRQEDAIVAISRAVRPRARGLEDPRRPIGSFIFLGPTGVGKTELTKALAQVHVGEVRRAIQLDISSLWSDTRPHAWLGRLPLCWYEDAGQLDRGLAATPTRSSS